MTIKELKNKLENFTEDCIVLVYNSTGDIVKSSNIEIGLFVEQDMQAGFVSSTDAKQAVLINPDE